MREETLLLAIIIVGTAALPSTTEPSWAPTGRLSQFRGFVTPKPQDIPEDVRMMYASVWASWSAWSFCSNGVRMRVRACNTVRGFSCLGPNQETRPCDAIFPPSGDKKATTDYDVVDPWEADRREAMKQLYPDDQDIGANPPPKENNFIDTPLPPPRRITAPPGARVIDHSLVGFEEHRPVNEADGSPGSDPEKLFGAKQFAVKSIIPNEFKEAKHAVLESAELNRLVAMNAKSSEEPLEERKSFEDISKGRLTTLSADTSTATTITSPVETKIITERQRSSGTTDRDEKVSKAIGEDIAKTFSDPEEDKAKEVLDSSFEDAEVMGTNPTRVKPKLSPTAVDDNLEDLLEVIEGNSDEGTITTTTEEPQTFPATELDIPEPTELPLAETDLVNAIAAASARSRQKISSEKRKRIKQKNFGFTGFALKKAAIEDGSIQKLHDGEITRVHFRLGQSQEELNSSTTTTTTTTTAPFTRTFSNSDTIHAPTHRLEEPEISMDTLNALDWMLKNMTQAAAKEDKVFLSKITETGIGPREEEIKDSFPILPSEVGEDQEPERPKKQRKLRRKLKKVKKFEITKLHDGEYTPRSLDKKKMFPKFKARSMKIKKTRALGVRTINSEKDMLSEIPTKESLTAEMDNPDQIFEEVKQLQAEMQQLEKQIGQYNSQEIPSLQKALHDPLLEGIRLDLGAVTKKELLPSISSGPEPMRILTPLESTPIETRWAPWSEWGECFCGIQLRTRICIFGGNSSGCKGATHESRTCSGGSCPSQSNSQRTGVFEYNGGPIRPRRLQTTR